MRDSFFRALEEKAKVDKDIYLLTGDLGFRLFDSFRASCPDNFLDAGVAEANMVGVAAGLSLSGKKPYCYSIVPFLVMRAFEQIRVDIAYHNLNVTLIGVGGGICYGLEGFTHFALEDLSLMRSLPNMTIAIPADPQEAQVVAEQSCEWKGPLYVRLGKTGGPLIHDSMPRLEIGKAMVLSEGRSVAIFAIGNMVLEAKRIAELMRAQGMEPTIVNMHTLKPLDIKSILEIASRHEAIFSIEEHYVTGGLGSALAETLIESEWRGLFKRFGLPDQLEPGRIGSAEYLREYYGLTAKAICGVIFRELKRQ